LYTINGELSRPKSAFFAVPCCFLAADQTGEHPYSQRSGSTLS
jgi:hypothetical protein